MVKPLTFEQCVEARANREFPDYVIETFNKLLIEELQTTGSVSARLDQDKIIDTMIVCAAQQHVNLTRNDIFNQKLLDVEDVYRKAGWNVEYFNLSFVFKRRS